METITIDFRDTVAKRVSALPTRVREWLAAPLSAESLLTAGLPAPVPAPLPVPARPKRRRRPSLKTIVRQARAAGAVRVEYGEAVIYLTEDGRPQAANSNAAERNEWDEKYGHH